MRGVREGFTAQKTAARFAATFRGLPGCLCGAAAWLEDLPRLGATAEGFFVTWCAAGLSFGTQCKGLTDD
jgi:hypothetical protein